MINHDFLKDEIFPLLHPFSPNVSAPCAAKSTPILILGYPLSADQVLSKSELTLVQGCYMKSLIFDTGTLKLGISVANLDENSRNLVSTGGPFMVRTWLRESFRQFEQEW